MALSSAIVWEVRDTGASTNGGGFKVGATGTDWTQQAAAQYSVTDGVTAGTTTLTSLTANFGTDVVGNIIYVAGGTGSVTAARYEITARTNSTTITVDRSTGLTAGTGVTLKIGGCLDGLVTLATAFVASNKAWINGSLTQTATATFNVNSTPDYLTPPNHIEGYTATRGDGGRATITLSGSSLTAMSITNNGFNIENLFIDCANQTTSTGIAYGTNANYGMVRNCKVTRYTTAAITFATSATAGNIIDSEIGAGTSSGGAININGSACHVTDNWIHDVTGIGFKCGSGVPVAFTDNTVTNCSTYGAQVDYCALVRGNTFYNPSATASLYVAAQYNMGLNIRNNIFAGNGGSAIGFKANSAGSARDDGYWDGNAYYNNGGGNKVNTGNISVGTNASGAYTLSKDVVATGDPFVAKASDDYRLNATASAGAALRGHGVPASWAGNALMTSARDFGAAQHTDAGGVPASRIQLGQ